MRVRMLATRRGSEDGFVLRVFYIHRVYETTRLLGGRFIQAGHAELYPVMLNLFQHR